jgi:hypothetical protein
MAAPSAAMEPVRILLRAGVASSFSLAIFAFLCYIFSKRDLASAGESFRAARRKGLSFLRRYGRRKRRHEKVHKDQNSGGGRSRAYDHPAQHQIGQEDRKPAGIVRIKASAPKADALIFGS